MTVVAAIQMTSTNELDANMQQVDELLARASAAGAKLVVLPENFAVFGAESQHATAARFPEIVSALQAYCRRHGLWLVAGSIPAACRPDGSPVPDGRLRSACLVLDAQGEIRARYDKIHLFDVDVPDAQGSYRESAVFEPGERPVVVSTPWGVVGLAICYDLRFPELFMALRREGAQFLVLPAAFTAVTGEAHWQALLRARAIENQCFVIAAAQSGQHNALRQTWGHSLVIDPWGRVLAEQTQTGPGVAVAECDAGTLTDIRQRMPLMAHRRLC